MNYLLIFCELLIIMSSSMIDNCCYMIHNLILTFLCFCVSRFGRDKGKLTRKITKVFTNKFDKPYYSWSCVDQDKKERFFIEFAVKLFDS